MWLSHPLAPGAHRLWATLSLFALPLLLGCDSQSGQVAVVLVYELELGDENTTPESDVAERVARVLGDRLPAQGSAKSTLDGRVEVQVFKPFSKTELPVVRHGIEQFGTLELRIAANHRDHGEVIALAQWQSTDTVLDETGQEVARWIPLQSIGAFDRFEDSDLVIRGHEPAGGRAKRLLVLVDPFDVTGDFLKSAVRMIDPTGRPSLAVHLNEQGGLRMKLCSRMYQPDDDGFHRHLAIVVNGLAYSAPAINAVMGAEFVIEGQFTPEEIDSLVRAFESGALPCPIRLVEERWAAE